MIRPNDFVRSFDLIHIDPINSSVNIGITHVIIVLDANTINIVIVIVISIMIIIDFLFLIDLPF
jgi:hypothetical protein